MLSARAYFSWHREFKNVSTNHYHFLVSYPITVEEVAGLIPSHPACTTTEQQWRS